MGGERAHLVWAGGDQRQARDRHRGVAPVHRTGEAGEASAIHRRAEHQQQQQQRAIAPRS